MRFVALCCGRVSFGMSVAVGSVGRSPVRHGMAVKASWVALRYVLLCQGSHGTSRHDDVWYFGARQGYKFFN